MMALKGRRVGVFGLITHSVWTFIRIYLLRRGFLDGRHGFVLAVTAASGSFLRYSKLMFLNEANQRPQPGHVNQTQQPTQSGAMSQANSSLKSGLLSQSQERSEPK
jgi:cobalamin synthase